MSDGDAERRAQMAALLRDEVRREDKPARRRPQPVQVDCASNASPRSVRRSPRVNTFADAGLRAGFQVKRSDSFRVTKGPETAGVCSGRRHIPRSFDSNGAQDAFMSWAHGPDDRRVPPSPGLGGRKRREHIQETTVGSSLVRERQRSPMHARRQSVASVQKQVELLGSLQLGSGGDESKHRPTRKKVAGPCDASLRDLDGGLRLSYAGHDSPRASPSRRYFQQPSTFGSGRRLCRRQPEQGSTPRHLTQDEINGRPRGLRRISTPTRQGPDVPDLMFYGNTKPPPGCRTKLGVVARACTPSPRRNRPKDIPVPWRLDIPDAGSARRCYTDKGKRAYSETPALMGASAQRAAPEARSGRRSDPLPDSRSVIRPDVPSRERQQSKGIRVYDAPESQWTMHNERAEYVPPASLRTKPEPWHLQAGPEWKPRLGRRVASQPPPQVRECAL